VTRSKQRALQWTRKAAEKGHTKSCEQIAQWMYAYRPYAREVGRVGEAAAAGVATSAGVMGGHDVPPDVLIGVLHWLRTGGFDLVVVLDEFRTMELEGHNYCGNNGCEVVGHLNDFKVCPQCKTVRYCATRVRNRTGRRVDIS